MPTSFNWAQLNGAIPGTVTELAVSGNLANYKNIDDATPGNYSSYPIKLSDGVNLGNSYEVVLRPHFTGTFNTISNLKFWKSVNFSPNTGLTDKYGVVAIAGYTQPTKDTSLIAVTVVPTVTPVSANVSIGGNLAGELDAAGYADCIYLQLHMGKTANPGDTALATYSIEWDET